MKNLHYAFFCSCLCTAAAIASAQSASGLNLQQAVSLPGVTGKFDHFAADEAGHRLFAAATGNQSVEVIDLATGKVSDSLTGFGKPHGLAWIPATHRLFVADGSKAELAVFEGSPLKRIKSIALSEDADDMVFDEATNLLYVGHGGTNAANPAEIAVIDASALTVVANVPVASHPEALERDAQGDRIFANIADDGQVAVIDGKTRHVAADWKLKGAKGNTPLAYDAQENLLLVGCRNPAVLLVLDARTGEEISRAASDPGADDLFYEPSTHHAYLIAGSGAVDTYALSGNGKLTQLPVTHTVSGAKTGLLVPEQGLLFVGLPGVAGPSKVNVYQTK